MINKVICLFDKLVTASWMIFPRFLIVVIWSVYAVVIYRYHEYFYPWELAIFGIGGMLLVFVTAFLNVMHDVLHDAEWVQHMRKFPDYD